MQIKCNLSFLLLLFCIFVFTHGKNEKKVEDKSAIDALRSEIFNINQPDNSKSREKSNEMLAEINLEKDKILKSPNSIELSSNLTKLLQGSAKSTDSIVGIAIEDPNINVIDNHVEEIVNPEVLDNFHPDLDEIKQLTKLRHAESDIQNLYRENLVIKSIREVVNFKIGKDVDQWKVIALENEKALIGASHNKIILVIGSEGKFEIVNEVDLKNVTIKRNCLETLSVWDDSLNKVRNLVIIAADGELIWYELSNNSLIEIYRWRLMKNIDKLSYFKHDGSDLIMLTTIDEQKRIEVEFIEFNFPNEEFWVVQAFKLPNLPESMVCIESGKDLIVAFTQESHVTIYRHQSTKFERGKFSFMKNIEAANVTVISGFRIGGYSYLAIGGDQPQILRYINGDFLPQTILSQTFGHVEEFLPIPIKFFRDDLILLVQHRITFRTHSLVAVDAVIWNGIAFESALSVPCQIVADPNLNGFTCILDFDREDGILGSAFILEEKNNSFYIIIPRSDVHSGLFNVQYEIVEAEDPLIKEMEQVKKAIELINGMLDIEMSVKEQVDEALKKSINPNQNFEFENLEIDEIDTDIIHFDGNVTLESDRIEFLDVTYTREDFTADLDAIEKTLLQDEERVKEIDAELNKLIRKNRQTHNVSSAYIDSPIYYLGPYTYNGQLNAKTIHVLPNDNYQQSRRQRRQVESIGDSTISDLKVKHLTVLNTINGIPVNDFLFLDENGELFVPEKDIVFEESIQAGYVEMLNDGRVNGIDFSHEILAIDSMNFPKSLTFDDINTDSLIVDTLNGIAVDATSIHEINVDFDDEKRPSITAEKANVQHNLKVETINGVNWDDFMSKLILKNSRSTASNLTVNGDIWIIDETSEINIDSLNHLAFPDEYVLKVGAVPSTVITGRKVFKNLATNAIDTDGTINGINPSEMITLDQPQDIPSSTTFNVMEVVKKLEVHGTIAGQKLHEFLPNPSLEVTNKILASCSFSELIVDGVVKVEGLFNNEKLENLLTEVVYDDSDEEVVIESQKKFVNLQVDGDVHITNNFINDIKIDNIMTAHEDQVATLNTLHGDVFITNLKLEGLFDGINVTELEMNSVRTNGDQYIHTPIIITAPFYADANSIDIKNSLNKIPIDDYFFIDDEIKFPPNVKVRFNELNLNSIKINGDIKGSGFLTNIDLNDIKLNHLSKSVKQTIQVPVKINKLITKNVFDGTFINGMDFATFQGYMKTLKNFKNVLLLSNQKIDNLIIDGDVNINLINGKNFDYIIKNVIWLNRQNEIEENIKFLDDIVIDGKLSLQHKLNNKNFSHFIDNWISSSENPIIINSDKIFNKDVIVEENLDVASINGMKYESILKKEDILEIDRLNIIGSVNAKNIVINDTFNHERLHHLFEIYSFNQGSNTHVINSDVKFNQNVTIEYLDTPHINEINISHWMSDLIRTNDHEVYVKGNKKFKGNILAEQGIFIDYFNEIDVKELMRNVILIRNDEIVNINSNLVFENDVYVHLVGLRGNLSTDSISGCDLSEWLAQGISTSHDFYYRGDLRADSSLIKTENLKILKLNGILFDHIFTLNTNQSFDYNIFVNGTVSIQEPLVIRGTVNGLDIKKEFENTVLMNGNNQVVYTDMILPGALVQQSITTSGHINAKQINKIITLDSSPTFDSSLTFSSLEAISLLSDNRISGINFTKWYDETLWKNGKDEQVISGNWKIKKAFLNENVYGNGLINNKPINEIEKNLKINVNAIEMAISNYSGQFSNVCEKLQHETETYAKNSVYILKYFEKDFSVFENEDIFSYFTFKTTDQENYLLINTNCTTQVYKWNRDDGKFIKISSIETGVIYNWIKLEPQTNKGIFIITNSRMAANAPCYYGGLNSWKLVDDKMIHIKTISDEADVLELHVDLMNFNSFYALENSDHVINYDVFGSALEKWKLPTENFTYSFLPSNILFGLNLNNGRRIFSLNSKYLKRGRRFLFSDAPIMKSTKTPSTSSDSPMFTFKMPDISFNERKNSIPTIPSKPIKTTKRIDFMSKVKEAGEVIRRSFNLQTAIMPDSVKKSKATMNETAMGSKLARLNETNKVLLIINSPNITSLKQNIDTRKKTQNSSTSNLSQQLQSELQKGLNEISIKNNKTFEITSSTEKIVPTITTTTDSIESTLTTEKSVPTSTAQIIETSTKVQEVATESTTQKHLASIFSITPRIIMPDDDEVFIDETLKQHEPAITNIDGNRDEIEVEASIVQGSGIREMENLFIPERGFGEVTVLHVGTEKNRKPLYVVTRKRNSFIKGDDYIEIYSDIIEGRVFQYIRCNDPSNIVALQFRDETLLAFMESQREVHIFIYRGIEGFTFFKKFQLPNYAKHMSSFILPPKIHYKCDNHNLVFQIDQELLFIRLRVDGNCGMSKVQCEM